MDFTATDDSSIIPTFSCMPPPPPRDRKVSFTIQNLPSTAAKLSGLNSKSRRRNDSQILPGFSSKRARETPFVKQELTSNNKVYLEHTYWSSNTHVIFCIDCSGSMRVCDVKKGNRFLSRWNAVFECADNFVLEQVENRSDVDVDVDFSLVIFNVEAKVLFNRIPLGDGSVIRQKLKSECLMNTPREGTAFSPAFYAVRKLAAKSTGAVMVVFLSDGRPADLNPIPPPEGKSIQATYKFYGSEKPSAAQRIEGLISDHGKRLSLQIVCIFKEGKPWLKTLADRYSGTFHMSNLDVDESASLPPSPERRVLAANSTGTTAVETELQLIGSKTFEMQYKERYNQAVASGTLLEIPESSSMRATFSIISTALTSMQCTEFPAKRPSKERQGVVLESLSKVETTLKRFSATRMILHPSQPKFVQPSNEEPDGRIVTLSSQPFAQGGFRNVYRMTEMRTSEILYSSPVNLVAKESRHEVPYAERLKFHQETTRCQERAAELAKKFNDKVAVGTEMLILVVTFLRADVYRLKDASVPGGFRYLAVEDQLDGAYEKYNSNNGYVLTPRDITCKEEVKRIEVAQAYSHFTFECNNGDEIVVDIQGSGYCYTDPQIHSKSGIYGRADRGSKGMADFFRTHRCNAFCKALELPNREQIVT